MRKIHNPAGKPSEELIITRIFNAPRRIVWKAWTDPEFLKRWWGPKHFTAPVSRIDFRVGGKYLNCMRSPEGKDYWGTGVYREIVPLERIVCTDSFADEKGSVVPASHYGLPGEWPLEMLVTVLFAETDGKTKMTLRHLGIPAGEMAQDTRAGWIESFDKLAKIFMTKPALTGIAAEPDRQEVVITRVFDAPRNLVFKACTDPDLIPQWWGPKRFTTMVDRMDVRPGGLWRFVQLDAAGKQYAFHGVYHEVLPPERIVNTFEFEGTPGQVSLETLILEDIVGKTKITTRSVFQTVGARDAMLKSGMEEGVIETMDRLAVLLEKLNSERKAA